MKLKSPVKIRRTYDFLEIKKLNDVLFPLDPMTYNLDHFYWIVKYQDHKIGFCSMYFCKDTGEPNVVFLSRAGLLPEFRKMGIGKRLLVTRMKEAKRMGAKSVITYTIDNVSSANNLISKGFKLYDPSYRYGGKGALHWYKRL